MPREPEQPRRTVRFRTAVDSWYASLAPPVGLAAALICLLLGKTEGIVPFAGVAMLPSVLKAQIKRNDRRAEE